LAGLSTSNAAYVAQILGAESFHAGALRLLSIQSSAPYINSGDGLDVPPYDPNSAALAAAGPAALGGFFASAGGAAASTNTTEGLAYTRTTRRFSQSYTAHLHRPALLSYLHRPEPILAASSPVE
jgi:hypothetical protein